MTISAITGVTYPLTSSVGGTTDTTSAAQASSSTATATSSDATSSASAILYSSPIVTIDAITGALIQEWRDPQTGAELYQSPSQTALLYEQAQSRGSGSGTRGASSSVGFYT